MTLSAKHKVLIYDEKEDFTVIDYSFVHLANAIAAVNNFELIAIRNAWCLTTPEYYWMMRLVVRLQAWSETFVRIYNISGNNAKPTEMQFLSVRRKRVAKNVRIFYLK